MNAESSMLGLCKKNMFAMSTIGLKTMLGAHGRL